MHAILAKKMKLRGKTTIILIVLLVVAVALNVVWSDYTQREQAEAEMLEKARILTYEMDAVWEFMEMCIRDRVYMEDEGIVRKCDSCYLLREKGESPACVAACPMRALDFGEVSDLRGAFGDAADLAPLPPSDATQPNLAITLPRHAARAAEGSIENAREIV